MAPTCDRLTLLLCCGIAAVTVIAFRELLPPVIIGASLAVVLIPAHRRLSARVGITPSATLLTAWMMVGVIAIVAIVAAVLAASTGFLLDMIDTVTGWLPVPTVTGDGLLGVVDGLLPGIPLFLVQVIVLFLSLYFFIFRGERLETDLRGILPEPFEPALGRIERAMADTLHSLYIVNVATALVAFILAIPLFSILGYGHVLLFSLLTAIFMLVPVVGAAVVMLLVALYALARGDLWQAVLTGAVIFPLISGICDGYLRPRLRVGRTRLHPVVLFVGFLAGAVSMGLFGLLIGPIIAAFLVALYCEVTSGDDGGRISVG